MTRNIGTQAVIDQVRLEQQTAHPTSPDSGYELLYVISGSPHGGLYLKDSSGGQIGPFITGSAVGSGRTLIEEAFPTGTSHTFSGIPGTYRKLVLEFTIRSTDGATSVDGNLQFNGDTTAANYNYIHYRTNPFGATNSNGANFLFAQTIIPGGGATATYAAKGIIEIIHYTNTTFYKGARVQIIAYENAFQQQSSGGMNWANTSAITQITLSLSAGNFVAGSSICLYGES